MYKHNTYIYLCFRQMQFVRSTLNYGNGFGLKTFNVVKPLRGWATYSKTHFIGLVLVNKFSKFTKDIRIGLLASGGIVINI